MRIEHLRDLIAIAASGSITAASQKLFISQSSLSTMLKAMEEELGVTIFTRTAKGILPTRDGELLIAFAKEVTERHDDLLQELSSRNTISQDASLVTYACASSFISLYLTQRILKYYPNAVLTIHEVPESQILRSLLNGMGNIALGLVPTTNLDNYRMLAQKNHLEMEVLYNDCVDLCVGKDSPYIGRTSVHVSELKDELMAVSHCCMKNLQSGEAGRNISRVTVFGNIGLVKQAVAKGGMIAFLPRLALQGDPLLECGAIQQIPVNGVVFTQSNCLFYCNQKQLNGLERLALDNIRDYFNSLV